MPGSERAFAADESRALELDAELKLAAHLERQFDHHVARGLALLWQERRHLALSRTSPIEFAREIMGMKESRTRWFARVGRTLLAVPEIDRAHSEGRISAAQVIVISRVVDDTTSIEERAVWIDRATRMTVRALAREVQVEKRRRAAEAAIPPTSDEAVSDAAEVEATVADATQAPPDGEWMSISATARAALVWQEAVELARRASGSQITQGKCAEVIVAEYLSAHPEAAADPAAKPADRPLDPIAAEVIAALKSGRARLATDSPPLAADSAPTASQREVGTNPVPPPRIENPPPLPEDCVISEGLDPIELGTRLKRLSERKKTLRYDLAAGLARLRETGDWYRLGCRSFEEYCTTRLGFCVRRAERLIRFFEGLQKFPGIRKAYLEDGRGGMSYTRTLLLLSIVHPSTEEAWLAWFRGDHVPKEMKPGPNRISYRELERVVEYARMYMLPGATSRILASWVKGLADHGLVAGPVSERIRTEQVNGREANAFVVDNCAAPPDPAQAAVPNGYALPPAQDGDLPPITGVPPDLIFTESKREVARIRFWLPKDVVPLFQKALDHARRTSKDPLQPTWVYLEIILVHFIRTIDNPEARRANRRHPILVRDGFRCTIPGCMHRALESHHFKHRSEGGPDEEWNQAGACGCHHRLGVHIGGTIEIGGWAPYWVVRKLGIHPKTGRAFISYINEREVTEEVADRELARWRRWEREWEEARRNGAELPAVPDYARGHIATDDPTQSKSLL